VQRRASVDAMPRAGRSRKLGVVVDPVEPEQLRGRRRREDPGLERVTPTGKEKSLLGQLATTALTALETPTWSPTSPSRCASPAVSAVREARCPP
jgi:hypothetical protein